MADDILINISEPSPIEIDIALPSPLAFSLDAGVSIHNLLSGLQGGSIYDFYHLTAAEYANKYLHDALTDVQGGIANEHYHLSAAEYAALGTGAHNDLTGLQGGQAGQYYHMTAADYAARILGSGTIGHIPYFTEANVLGNSGIYYDAVNGRMGLAIAEPLQPLHIIGHCDATATGPLLITSDGVIGCALSLDATPNGGYKYSFISTGSGAPSGGGCFSLYTPQLGGYPFIIRNNGHVNIGFNKWLDYGRLGVFPESAIVKGLFIQGFAAQTANLFEIQNSANAVLNVIDATGKVGILIATPTAKLHLPASAAAANLASLKIDAGVVATTPVSGNVESDGTHLYWTDSGGNRRQLDNPA